MLDAKRKKLCHRRVKDPSIEEMKRNRSSHAECDVDRVLIHEVTYS